MNDVKDKVKGGISGIVFFAAILYLLSKLRIPSRDKEPEPERKSAQITKIYYYHKGMPTREYQEFDGSAIPANTLFTFALEVANTGNVPVRFTMYAAVIGGETKSSPWSILAHPGQSRFVGPSAYFAGLASGIYEVYLVAYDYNTGEVYDTRIMSFEVS